MVFNNWSRSLVLIAFGCSVLTQSVVASGFDSVMADVKAGGLLGLRMESQLLTNDLRVVEHLLPKGGLGAISIDEGAAKFLRLYRLDSTSLGQQASISRAFVIVDRTSGRIVGLSAGHLKPRKCRVEAPFVDYVSCHPLLFDLPGSSAPRFGYSFGPSGETFVTEKSLPGDLVVCLSYHSLTGCDVTIYKRGTSGLTANLGWRVDENGYAPGLAASVLHPGFCLYRKYQGLSDKWDPARMFISLKGIQVDVKDECRVEWEMPEAVTLGERGYRLANLQGGTVVVSDGAGAVSADCVKGRSCSSQESAVLEMCSGVGTGCVENYLRTPELWDHEVSRIDEFTFVRSPGGVVSANYKNIFISVRMKMTEPSKTCDAEQLLRAIVRAGIR